MMRWVPWLVLGLLVAAFAAAGLAGDDTDRSDLTYTQFIKQVRDGNVRTIDFNKTTGSIVGKFERVRGALPLGELQHVRRLVRLCMIKEDEVDLVGERFGIPAEPVTQVCALA